MAAALNAFMKISTAEGESKQGSYAGWIEIQSWEWEVEAESSWTKGSGASVGKPVPGKMSWEHYWDKSSNILLKFIYQGNSFDTIELHMCKSIGKGTPVPYWKAIMKQAFITKVNQSATEEGNVAQKVEMVFKEITTDYSQQGKDTSDPGRLDFVNKTTWNIEEGKIT